ncbi:rhomboid family intramembrane serine protease [Caulobacter sp. DWR2-3-1b2]|uniref:rhomboid family intramembrane serine protease n=1 Tax=unclassified Caulobacter TaxID=2648921 RepID=UPI003CE7B717
MSDEQTPPATETPRRETLWGRGPSMLWFEAWPVLVITALIWLVFAGQQIGEALGYGDAIFVLGALSKQGLAYGLWWTPLTHMFLHMGWLHIVMNSAALVALGPAIAQRLGRDWRGGLLFLVFYLICGLVGGAVFVLIAPPNGAAIGASGAIFGLWGAVARLAGPGEVRLAPIFSSSVLRQIGSAIISNLLVVGLGAAYGLASGVGIIGVAWQAHLGGFLAGMLLIQVLPVRFHWLMQPAPAR